MESSLEQSEDALAQDQDDTITTPVNAEDARRSEDVLSTTGSTEILPDYLTDAEPYPVAHIWAKNVEGKHRECRIIR